MNQIEGVLTDDDESKVLKRANVEADITRLMKDYDSVERIEQIRAQSMSEIKFLLEAIERETKMKEVSLLLSSL